MAACGATAIQTVYGTTTIFAVSTELTPTTYIAVDPRSVYTAFRTAGGTVTPFLATGTTYTTTSTVTNVATVGSGSVVSSAISTVSQSCAPPITSAIIIPDGGTTITSYTTVPQPSNPFPSSMMPTPTNANSNTGSSPGPPTAAIAGGVVGGVALLFVIGLAIWYFSGKSSRNERDRDFDFAGDDAWDPAAGVASDSMMGKRMSRRGTGRIGAAGGEMGMNGMGSNNVGGGGGGGGYGSDPYGNGGGGNEPRRENSRKKLTPAEEQFAYYSAAQPPPSQNGNINSGMAGIGGGGGLRRGPSGSAEHDYPEADPYGGLENSSNGNGNSYGQQQQQHQQQQQYGNGPQRNGSIQHQQYQQQPNYGQQQQQYQQSQGRSVSPQQGYYNNNQPYNQQQQMSNIPYHSPPSIGSTLSAPNTNRFDPTPQNLNSPTPSHRSIPALGAVYGNNGNNNNSNQDGNNNPDVGRRGGALRVMNEEPVENNSAGVGAGGGGYDSQTTGLITGSQSGHHQ